MTNGNKGLISHPSDKGKKRKDQSESLYDYLLPHDGNIQNEDFSKNFMTGKKGSQFLKDKYNSESNEECFTYHKTEG